MARTRKVPSALLHFVGIELRAMYLFQVATEHFIHDLLAGLYGESLIMSELAHYNGTYATFERCVDRGISEAMLSFDSGYRQQADNACVDFSHHHINFGVYFVWVIRTLACVYYLVCLVIFLRAKLVCASFRSGKYIAFTYEFETHPAFKAVAHFVLFMAIAECSIALYLTNMVSEGAFTSLLQKHFGALFALGTSAFMILTPACQPVFHWQGPFFSEALFRRPCHGYLPIVGQNNNDITRDLSLALLLSDRGDNRKLKRLLPDVDFQAARSALLAEISSSRIMDSSAELRLWS
eukprot:TRINITY_DN24457_c0_g1_i1.p1 TRINITY_DN24457_c0_g1~~TRINITY_DN24457_c0_g1_i1.p1  ORF type:complete len:294 (-),score=27.36 TRINITY_DN24457_c0_g1_i1:203-1084(-)